MKTFLMIGLLFGLGACSWLGGIVGDKPDEVVKREEFHACPYLQADGSNHKSCPKGDPKGKGICMPSGELHSKAELCDKIK